jgi:hypothetical protein
MLARAAKARRWPGLSLSYPTVTCDWDSRVYTPVPCASLQENPPPGWSTIAKGLASENPHPHASHIADVPREPCAPLRCANGKGCCHTPGRNHFDAAVRLFEILLPSSRLSLADRLQVVAKEINVGGLSEKDQTEAMQEVEVTSRIPASPNVFPQPSASFL